MSDDKDVNWLDAEELIGQRFACDFKVIAVAQARPGTLYDPDRRVTLQRMGDGELFEISLGELRTAVEADFVQPGQGGTPVRRLTAH